MKRSYSTAFPICRPEESVLLVETGGKLLRKGNSTTKDENITLNMPMFMTSSFQYDNLLWAKDFYTFNQQNTLVGLLFLSWNTVTKYYRFILWPVMLPYLNLTNNNDDTQEGFLKLQNQLVYGLNLKFLAGSVEYMPITANFVLSPTEWYELHIGDETCPLFNELVQGPLLWNLHNGHLVLCENQNYVPSGSNAYEFAFNLITFEYEFFNNTNYYRITDGHFFSADRNKRPQMNHIMFGPEKGWFGRGAEVFGFGSLDIDTHRYVDDYSGSERFEVFGRCTTINGPPTTQFADINEFNAFVTQNKLKRKIMIGPKVASLVPSRYYTITSKTLSATQTSLVVSNNSRLSHNIIDVLFNGLKGKTGNTLSDDRPEYSKLYHGLSPVLNIERLRARNVIDLTVKDEYGDEVNNYNLTQDIDKSYYNQMHRGNAFFAYTLAGNPYAPLNPEPIANPDGQTCFQAVRLNETPMWGNPPTVTGIYPNFDNASKIACPPSSFLLHFGKCFVG